jgi:SEL1 protein
LTLQVNPVHRQGEGRELDAGKQTDGAETAVVGDNRAVLDDMDDDGPWYLGKAKDEYKRKRNQDDAKRREDEDPIQVGFLFPFILFCSKTNLVGKGTTQ